MTCSAGCLLTFASTLALHRKDSTPVLLCAAHRDPPARIWTYHLRHHQSVHVCSAFQSPHFVDLIAADVRAPSPFPGDHAARIPFARALVYALSRRAAQPKEGLPTLLASFTMRVLLYEDPPSLFSSANLRSNSFNECLCSRYPFSCNQVNVDVSRLSDLPVPVGDSTCGDFGQSRKAFESGRGCSRLQSCHPRSLERRCA